MPTKRCWHSRADHPDQIRTRKMICLDPDDRSCWSSGVCMTAGVFLTSQKFPSSVEHGREISMVETIGMIFVLPLRHVHVLWLTTLQAVCLRMEEKCYRANQ